MKNIVIVLFINALFSFSVIQAEEKFANDVSRLAHKPLSVLDFGLYKLERYYETLKFNERYNFKLQYVHMEYTEYYENKIGWSVSINPRLRITIPSKGVISKEKATNICEDIFKTIEKDIKKNYGYVHYFSRQMFNSGGPSIEKFLNYNITIISSGNGHMQAECNYAIGKNKKEIVYWGF